MNEQIIKAWHDAENPPLDGTNPHYNSKFASLGACQKAAKEACKENALIVAPVYREGKQFMVATLYASEGREEVASCEMSLPTDPQKAGSAITYYRRYILTAALGMVGEEDDDGNGAAKAVADQKAADKKALADLKSAMTVLKEKGVPMADVMADLNAKYGDPKTYKAATSLEAIAHINSTYGG